MGIRAWGHCARVKLVSGIATSTTLALFGLGCGTHSGSGMPDAGTSVDAGGVDAPSRPEGGSADSAALDGVAGDAVVDGPSHPSSGADGSSACAAPAAATPDSGGSGPAHQILVSDDGVALSSMPTMSRLSATLKVSDSLGRATNWFASSDQPWLTVTATGTAGGSLTLTANPAGLAADAVHYATVSLCSDDPSVDHADTVRVGLWIGSSAPATSTSVSRQFSDLATDPIRPYAYVNSGGTDVTVYNVYTTQVVATIPSAGAQLASMAVATDGSRLFVVDAKNFQIVPIDLDAYTVRSPWPLASKNSVYLAAAHTQGVALLFTGDGHVYDVATGTRLAVPFNPGNSTGVIAVSQDGSRLCSVDTGLSPDTLSCFGLAFVSTPYWQLVIGPPETTLGSSPNGQSGSNGEDLAVNADGTRVYVASGAPYSFEGYDPTSSTLPDVQSLPGDAYPNNIEVMTDGRILAGADVADGMKDVWVYSSQGVLGFHEDIAGRGNGLRARELKASGDALRLAALTTTPVLAFFTIGP
jgi:hypothetical protein